jgi:hypothetical protein
VALLCCVRYPENKLRFRLRHSFLHSLFINGTEAIWLIICHPNKGANQFNAVSKYGQEKGSQVGQGGNSTEELSRSLAIVHGSNVSMEIIAQ